MTTSPTRKNLRLKRHNSGGKFRGQTRKTTPDHIKMLREDSRYCSRPLASTHTGFQGLVKRIFSYSVSFVIFSSPPI